MPLSFAQHSTLTVVFPESKPMTKTLNKTYTCREEWLSDIKNVVTTMWEKQYKRTIPNDYRYTAYRTRLYDLNVKYVRDIKITLPLRCTRAKIFTQELQERYPSITFEYEEDASIFGSCMKLKVHNTNNTGNAMNVIPPIWWMILIDRLCTFDVDSKTVHDLLVASDSCDDSLWFAPGDRSRHAYVWDSGVDCIPPHEWPLVSGQIQKKDAVARLRYDWKTNNCYGFTSWLEAGI